MSNLSRPAQNSVAAQQELFRRAKAEFGLTPAAIGKLTPIGKTTIEGWARGAAMPAWALGALGEAGVPDELLSLILAPFARHVGSDETGDGDLDTAADDAIAFGHAVQRARHPKSPGGVAIVPQEVAAIIPIGQRACASIRRVA